MLLRTWKEAVERNRGNTSPGHLRFVYQANKVGKQDFTITMAARIANEGCTNNTFSWGPGCTIKTSQTENKAHLVTSGGTVGIRFPRWEYLTTELLSILLPKVYLKVAICCCQINHSPFVFCRAARLRGNFNGCTPGNGWQAWYGFYTVTKTVITMYQLPKKRPPMVTDKGYYINVVRVEGLYTVTKKVCFLL